LILAGGNQDRIRKWSGRRRKNERVEELLRRILYLKSRGKLKEEEAIRNVRR